MYQTSAPAIAGCTRAGQATSPGSSFYTNPVVGLASIPPDLGDPKND